MFCIEDIVFQFRRSGRNRLNFNQLYFLIERLLKFCVGSLSTHTSGSMLIYFEVVQLGSRIDACELKEAGKFQRVDFCRMRALVENVDTPHLKEMKEPLREHA